MKEQQTQEHLRGTFHKDRNAYIVGQEPMIFHCHHYNVYLQAVIEDTQSYIDVYPILTDSAHEIVYEQFSNHFAQARYTSIEERKALVSEYFSFCGFGKIDLSGLTAEGGQVVAPSEHYGIGWLAKFGQRSKKERGVAFFAAGYLAGAFEAIYEHTPGTWACTQLQCLSQGDEQSLFQVGKRTKAIALEPSIKEGAYQSGILYQPAHTNVNYQGIRDALIMMPLEGSEKTGLIEAFGVLLTRMYANYYCAISYKLLKAFEASIGQDGLPLAAQLLTEAGHTCAYSTFGGIMQSTEWQGLIRPMLYSSEDWVHGIVAVVNALGWGLWKIEHLEAGKHLSLSITSGYEANHALIYLSKTEILPVSFLATGATAGIMNLIYNTSLTEQFITLDDQLYKQINQMPGIFRGVQAQCRVLQQSETDLFHGICQ